MIRILPTAHRRLPLGAALAAAVLATGACSENRPFERENTGSQAKLSVPTSITPPITVRGVNGAPAAWKLEERVAESLRSRDIPASAALRSRSALVLKGEMRHGPVRNGRGRVEVVWSLYDAVGKKLGEVTQMAAVPGAAFKTANEGVVEAMADAAAESIAPMVPSSSIRLADATETGERRPNDRARIEDRGRVTAVGRMPANSGVSKNLLAPPKRETKVDARADRARPPTRTARTVPPQRNAAPPDADKNAVTAVGRYRGTSALSRNLLRSDADPAKPLPPPQRIARDATTAPPAEAEESLGGPIPASDMRRSEAPAKARQRAEADLSKPDVGVGTERVREERARATRERQLAETNDRPAPRTTRAAPRGGYQYWVQLGANQDEAASRAQWQQIQATAGPVLAGIGNRIQRADLGARGTFYRIQIGPFASPVEAAQVCGRLKARQLACFMAAPEFASAKTPPAEKPRAAPPAKPAEARAKPPVEKPAPANTPPAAKNASPEKPKDTASAPPAKKSDNGSKPAPAKTDNKPPANAKAEKPDAPISTAPGLPGVLD